VFGVKRWFAWILIGMMILSGCTQQAEQKENPSSEAEPKEESVTDHWFIKANAG
jgi:PBP1b-binding outer membrane lipoprotein LpoB